MAALKVINLRDRDIAYTLRTNSRSRRIRLSVSRAGAVTVTMPAFIREAVAERFLLEKTQWLLAALAKVERYASRPIVRYGRRDFTKHRLAAYQMVRARLAALNERYGFRHGAVSIRNQKSRWGSCTKNGNLNFNFRLLFLPERLRDYIIVHELCHLKELNHSKRFWNLVAVTFPDHKKIRADLRTHGLS
ncbi:MAG: SprT family zinc-dependent metalloprotease [Patescibacteria group bacterium]